MRVIRIGTVPHQMLFDKDRIVVPAGKPVELVFRNTDIMPHNLVVTKPGALVKIGMAAETLATEPGALERGYVPRSRDILFASKLLQPRESETLRFVAPKKPGVYPYVCTYPGHWRRMFGAMYVVEQVDATPAERIEAHTQVLAADPTDVESRLFLAEQACDAGRIDEARRLLATPGILLTPGGILLVARIALADGDVPVPREAILATVAVDDVDGAPGVEVVAATLEGGLYVWNHLGQRLPRFPVRTDPALSDPPRYHSQHWALKRRIEAVSRAHIASQAEAAEVATFFYIQA